MPVRLSSIQNPTMVWYAYLAQISRFGTILGGDILYMSNSKTRLWLVFTLFSLFLLAEHFVQFGMPIGKLA